MMMEGSHAREPNDDPFRSVRWKRSMKPFDWGLPTFVEQCLISSSWRKCSWGRLSGQPQYSRPLSLRTFRPVAGPDHGAGLLTAATPPRPVRRG